MSDFFPFNTINEKLHSDLSHLEPKLLFSVAFIGRGFSISVWMNRRCFLPVIRVKRCSRTVYSPYSMVYDFPIRDCKVVLHIRHCFPKASRVIDRFYVQRLTFDVLQEMRISHRWDAINEETDARLSLANGMIRLPTASSSHSTQSPQLYMSTTMRYSTFLSTEVRMPQQNLSMQRSKLSGRL